MKGQQPRVPGAFDLLLQFGVPPDVIQVHRHAERAAGLRVEQVADIQRLLQRVDAGAVCRVHRVQRFDGQRHGAFACVVQQGGNAFGDLLARTSEAAVRGCAGQRTRQAADHQHQTRRAQRAGFVERTAVVVARGLPAGAVGVGEHATAAVA